METIGLLATLHAKPGKESELEAFLKSALPLARQENGTIRWYAIRITPSVFGIFDTFAAEAGRDAHLSGEIAKALMSKADELLAKPPQIEKIDILAVKD
jgi:quinol monooxygenase YgiN